MALDGGALNHQMTKAVWTDVLFTPVEIARGGFFQ